MSDGPRVTAASWRGVRTAPVGDGTRSRDRAPLRTCEQVAKILQALEGAKRPLTRQRILQIEDAALKKIRSAIVGEQH